MKSILVVIGTFLFSIFLEGFIRVIILFYHQQEFHLFGTESLPGLSWILIVAVSVFLCSWISSMLSVTLTNYAAGKHLIALAVLFLGWRLLEILQIGFSENTLYSLSFISLQLLAVYLAYLFKKSMNATPTT